MKRSICLFVIFALLLPLCACGAAPAPAPAEGVSALAEAAYPDMAPYPDEADYLTLSGDLKDEYYDAYDAWRADVRARRELAAGSAEELAPFLAAALPAFLSGEDGENRVFSPLNVYLALGMLAEVTAGESRAQLLRLLGAEDMDALRSQASALWNADYRDDGAVMSRLAASFWLDEAGEYDARTLSALAERWYASAYAGEMGSDALNTALRAWLSEQTGGLLDDAIGGLETTPETLLVLAATLCFKARWTDEFSPAATESGIFRGDDGDHPCNFMRQSGARTYYWGENFSAVFQNMENGGGMWFLLPDEGVSPEALLAEEEALAFLLSPGSTGGQKYLTVHLSVPRFDAASDTDLIPGLRSLGVTDVFDPRLSDFTPLTKQEGLAVSQARHAARVTIDEEGCEAAAYTVIMTAGAAMPPAEEVDFVLDRPFLFLVTGAEGAPLFAGVVHRPGE